MRSGTGSSGTSGAHSTDVSEALAAFLARLEPRKVGKVEVVRVRRFESDDQLLFLDVALDALGLRP